MGGRRRNLAKVDSELRDGDKHPCHRVPNICPYNVNASIFLGSIVQEFFVGNMNIIIYNG